MKAWLSMCHYLSGCGNQITEIAIEKGYNAPTFVWQIKGINFSVATSVNLTLTQQVNDSNKPKFKSDFRTWGMRYQHVIDADKFIRFDISVLLPLTVLLPLRRDLMITAAFIWMRCVIVPSHHFKWSSVSRPLDTSFCHSSYNHEYVQSCGL